MIEPNTSVATSVATSRDLHPHTHAHVSLSRSFTCGHCQTEGTTWRGALWRVAPSPAPGALYYLHTRCLDPYKVAHGLRSVEGRVPLTSGFHGAPATSDALAVTSPTSVTAAPVDTTVAAS